MVYEIRTMKKITVIISAGDTDKYMEETLDSLSAQSIVNDIEIIDQTKPGQITRGDEVLNKAEGKYLYFMNSGDLLTSFASDEMEYTLDGVDFRQEEERQSENNFLSPQFSLKYTNQLQIGRASCRERV